MNEMVPVNEYEREVSAIDASTLAVISRQEIDVQIATAHRFPRSVKAFRNDVADMTTLNEEVAAECSYALPRDGKLIEGPSARFAEVLLSSWGNCRAAARVVNDDGNFITAQGIFHDLQKNSAVCFEVRRRIVDKNGRRFKDDMIAVTGNAASSIALRNAILKGIPKALWADLWSQARKTAHGDHKTLANRRADALKLFQGYGVSAERLCEFLSIRGPEEITSDHLMGLRGMATAFKEGDTTPEAVFGDPSKPAAPKAPPRTVAQKLEDFGADLPPPAAETPAASLPAGTPASSDPMQDDAGNPPDEPETEKFSPMEEARQAGRGACEAGVDFKDVPEKYRVNAYWRKAWKEGYQEFAQEAGA